MDPELAISSPYVPLATTELAKVYEYINVAHTLAHAGQRDALSEQLDKPLMNI